MSKLLFLLLAILVVYWILRAYRKRIDRSQGPGKPASEEDMVRCEHCGVHLPRSESVTTRGIHFCSADHQRRHLQSD